MNSECSQEHFRANLWIFAGFWIGFGTGTQFCPALSKTVQGILEFKISLASSLG